MDDYASKLADLLEEIALRVRSMTVDRVEKAAKWTSIGIVVAMLAFLLLVFVLIGLFRILGTLMPIAWAYFIIGGIFLIIGGFLWGSRRPSPEEGTEE
jgi:predicted membrane channel-forming protein YqfA (hemolysin III family)